MPINIMTEEKLKRLPKWVQTYIIGLEKKNDALISLLNGDPQTDVKVDLYMSGCQRYLPNRSTVHYSLSPGLYVDVRLRKQDRRGNVVEIYTSDQAVILPEATNHFHIVSARRFSVVAENVPPMPPERVK